MTLISEYLAADSSPDASADALAIINNRKARLWSVTSEYLIQGWLYLSIPVLEKSQQGSDRTAWRGSGEPGVLSV